ncbi:hypothetical protein OPV22_020365 [Ensete ventricosum]|uniref:C3H1-type domain-containing protein n=1 Tax=Ensete ventricosum TaxID=4639 RepID=A0AAV8QPU9_ENSVE|nr:hypothetical protein OPV22_020365 [Ensete ventricosum]
MVRVSEMGAAKEHNRLFWETVWVIYASLCGRLCQKPSLAIFFWLFLANPPPVPLRFPGRKGQPQKGRLNPASSTLLFSSRSICVWCWNNITQMAEKNGSEGRCPACRATYDKERILKITISTERLAKQDSQKVKMQKTKSKELELLKDLNNVRVIRRNLVYVAGIPVSLADEMVERRNSLDTKSQLEIRLQRFRYITFSKEDEALRCIEVDDGFSLNGSPLKASFGTTRYCHAWLKNMRCNNPDCLYVHDVCQQEDICTKDQVASTCARASSLTSGRLSYACVAQVDYPFIASNFAKKANEAGAQLPAHFQNVKVMWKYLQLEIA